MRGTLAHLRHMLDRRAIVVAGLLTLGLVAVAATPQLLGSRMSQAFDRIGEANPTWVWLAAACFVCSLVGSAGSWRSALGLCGGRLTLGESCSRYGVGSLVNSFTPARLGDVVRLGLFSRALGHRDRLWSTSGAFAALGAARGLVLTVLVLIAAGMGALPLWWLAIVVAPVVAAVSAAVLSRRIRSHGHVVHVLDAFRTLGRRPARGLRIVGWISLATLGRLGSGAAIAAAVGVHRPLIAALLIVPAIEVAGMLPLTPGNVGLTSGAITMALQAHQVPLTPALSAGIAFHGVETLVGILFGAGAALSLARPSRAWVVAVAATAGCLALVGLGATLFVDLT